VEGKGTGGEKEGEWGKRRGGGKRGKERGRNLPDQCQTVSYCFLA